MPCISTTRGNFEATREVWHVHSYRCERIFCSANSPSTRSPGLWRMPSPPEHPYHGGGRRSSSSASATSIDGGGPPHSRVASPLVAEAEGTRGVAPTPGALATQAPTAQAGATQAPTAQALATQAPTAQAGATQALTAQAGATQAPTAQAVTTQTPTAVPMVRVPPATPAGLVGPRVPRQRQYRGRPCPAHQRARSLPTGA
jgi:hypothetical protein